MTIIKAGENELEQVVHLALLLWPENEPDDLKKEFAPLLLSEEAAVYLAKDGSEWCGLAQCQLRHDYVEGTSSSPVGSLEGIYVVPKYRRKGVARALVAHCQIWAKEQGCGEFASDCEIENKGSLRFHLGVGFTEANRIICFTKTI